MEMTFNDIKDNKPLFDFCKRIWANKVALESDLRYLFLVSLISSDHLVDVKTCEKSLERIKFISDNVELFDLKPEIKQETIKFLKKGMRIVKKDLKEFKNKASN